MAIAEVSWNKRDNALCLKVRSPHAMLLACASIGFGIASADPASAAPTPPELPSSPGAALIPLPPEGSKLPSAALDSTPPMSLASANDRGAGLEFDVASFANSKGCAVDNRIRIDPNSSNAGIARAAAQAALATKTPIRATIARCDSYGTPLTASVWMARQQ